MKNMKLNVLHSSAIKKRRDAESKENLEAMILTMYSGTAS